MLMRYIACPSLYTSALLSPFFSQYQSSLWQKNSNCFAPKTSAFSENLIQQFCCYDNTSGSLIINGANAGFFYESRDVSSIITNGLQCCYQKTWNYCSLFYTAYPSSVLKTNDNTITIGWLGGDPQILTFDQFPYTFNGFGKFLMSKANDSTFELQGKMDIINRINNTNLTATIFTAFAMKSNKSPIIEIDLSNSADANPYFVLYVNKSNSGFSNFIRNLDYSQQLACTDNSNQMCTTIIQNAEGVQVIFYNVLSFQFKISTVILNSSQSFSWLANSVTFLNKPNNYSNALYGLMGNNNGNPTDDIVSVNGLLAANSTQRSIYDVAVTWQVDSSNDMFVNAASPSRSLTSQTFIPTFSDELAPPSAALLQSCNNQQFCVIDAILSGVLAMGIDTSAKIQATQSAVVQANIQVPIIVFLNSSVQIDWSLTGQPVILVAGVTDSTGNFVITLQVTNAANYTYKVQQLNTSQRLVVISYYPASGEYPLFQITATDLTSNASSVALATNLLICNCRSLDPTNSCVYGSIQSIVSPTSSLVACSCNQYYTGSFCQTVQNYCLLMNNLCNVYPSLNSPETCLPLTVSQQKNLSVSFQCIGGACSPGFAKNTNGACVDVNECSTGSPCLNGSTCINTIGSYRCECSAGYQYTNNACTMINYCNTPANNCNSICLPGVGTFTCACYTGYQLSPIDSATCVQTQNLAGCSLLNCQQVCTNLSSNSVACTCFNGYNLNSDGRTCSGVDECLVNNGGCAYNCTNTIASYYCSCPIGQKLSSDLKTCLTCPFNTFGLNCSQTCSCVNAKSCDSVLGCVCNTGFTGLNCATKINPCLNVIAPKNAQCVNTSVVASFVCLPGYQQLNASDPNCYSSNNCVPNLCPFNAVCINTPLTYTCNCSVGFIYNSLTGLCQDINECNLAPCPANSFCTNLPGTYTCTCSMPYVDAKQNSAAYSTTSPSCVLPSSVSTSTSQTATTKLATSANDLGLVLAIALPIAIVVIIAVIVGVLVCCWLKRYPAAASVIRGRGQPTSDVAIGTETVPAALTNSLPPLTGGLKRTRLDAITDPSMFVKNHDLIDFGDGNDNATALDNNRSNSNQGHPKRAIYRANYPIDKTIERGGDDFFRSLENKARSHQKTTIVRPQSTITDSSYSLPTAYYEQTTPYSEFQGQQYRKYRLDRDNNDNEDIHEDDNDQEDDDDTFGAFDNNEDDMNEIIEAFNPNVKIPRPKIQINPINIFKFGFKNDSAES